MAQRPIAIAKDKPELAALIAEGDAIQAQMNERIDFFKKKVDQLLEEFRPRRAELWGRIEALCKSTGILDPDVKLGGPDASGAHLHYEEGVLYFCDGEIPGRRALR